ncbi:MAG: Ig-like domain-containing protein, partial [Syntrophales bacterium]
IGLQQRFVAMGIYSDGTSLDISNTVTWSSGTIAVAAVVSPGVATGLSVGTATITAALGGKSGSATLAVTAATLSSIAVTPATATVVIGLTQRFVAMGIYSDGTSLDISNTVTWSSGTIAVATVLSPGVATGLSVGTATITAAFGGKSGSATLTVTAATLNSITVTPATATVGIGGTRPFAAMGTYSDATIVDITTFVTWTSNNPAASVLPTGVATGLSVGTATITAALGGNSGSATLTVTGVIPPPPSCAGPGPVDMGAAASFGVLVGPAGGATLTNNGLLTTVNGDVGAASEVTAPTITAGFFNYTGVDAPYVAAKAAMLTAISCATARPCGVGAAFNFGADHDFGGDTLAPGVYCVTGGMSVGSNLTLSTPGVYIFRSTGALTSANTITVAFGGTANATNTSVFWVPTGAASIGTNNAFLGTIMPAASAATTLGANTTLLGRAMSNSDVTLSTNTITRPIP